MNGILTSGTTVFFLAFSFYREYTWICSKQQAFSHVNGGPPHRQTPDISQSYFQLINHFSATNMK